MFELQKRSQKGLETAPRPSQVYTVIIIGICVAVIIIVSVLALIAREMIRRRKITISLNHPGPNYAPQSSRFEHVSIEMNQPLAVIGTSDGYKTIDASENTDLETDNVNARDDKTRKHPYEKWNKDFFGEFL